MVSGRISPAGKISPTGTIAQQVGAEEIPIRETKKKEEFPIAETKVEIRKKIIGFSPAVQQRIKEISKTGKFSEKELQLAAIQLTRKLQGQRATFWSDGRFQEKVADAYRFLAATPQIRRDLSRGVATKQRAKELGFSSVSEFQKYQGFAGVPAKKTEEIYPVPDKPSTKKIDLTSPSFRFLNPDVAPLFTFQPPDRTSTKKIDLTDPSYAFLNPDVAPLFTFQPVYKPVKKSVITESVISPVFPDTFGKQYDQPLGTSIKQSFSILGGNIQSLFREGDIGSFRDPFRPLERTRISERIGKPPAPLDPLRLFDRGTTDVEEKLGFLTEKQLLELKRQDKGSSKVSVDVIRAWEPGISTEELREKIINKERKEFQKKLTNEKNKLSIQVDSGKLTLEQANEKLSIKSEEIGKQFSNRLVKVLKPVQKITARDAAEVLLIGAEIALISTLPSQGLIAFGAGKTITGMARDDKSQILGGLALSGLGATGALRQTEKEIVALQLKELSQQPVSVGAVELRIEDGKSFLKATGSQELGSLRSEFTIGGEVVKKGESGFLLRSGKGELLTSGELDWNILSGRTGTRIVAVKQFDIGATGLGFPIGEIGTTGLGVGIEGEKILGTIGKGSIKSTIESSVLFKQPDPLFKSFIKDTSKASEKVLLDFTKNIEVGTGAFKSDFFAGVSKQLPKNLFTTRSGKITELGIDTQKGFFDFGFTGKDLGLTKVIGIPKPSESFFITPADITKTPLSTTFKLITKPTGAGLISQSLIKSNIGAATSGITDVVSATLPTTVTKGGAVAVPIIKDIKSPIEEDFGLGESIFSGLTPTGKIRGLDVGGKFGDFGTFEGRFGNLEGVGLGVTEKVKGGEKSIFDTLSDSFSKRKGGMKSIFDTGLERKGKEKKKIKTITDIFSKTFPKRKIKTSIIPTQRQPQKTRQPLKQESILGTTGTVSTIFTPSIDLPIIIPKIPVTFIPFGFPGLALPKEKKKKRGMGYNVFAKPVKGKGLLKVNINPLSRSRAEDLRNFIVDTSLGRTAKIKATKGLPKAPKLNIPFGYAQTSARKFRDYRISKGKKIPLSFGKLIERSSFLLDTPQERKKIGVAKRIAELKRKAGILPKKKKRRKHGKKKKTKNNR